MNLVEKLRLIGLHILLGLILLFVANPAFSTVSREVGNKPSIKRAVKITSVPERIHVAISRVETGGNGKGQSTWQWSFDNAGTLVQYASLNGLETASGLSISHGENNFEVWCFQINDCRHDNVFTSLPEMNSTHEYAAISMYHSPTKAKGEAYAKKVRSEMASFESADQVFFAKQSLSSPKALQDFARVVGRNSNVELSSVLSSSVRLRFP